MYWMQLKIWLVICRSEVDGAESVMRCYMSLGPVLSWFILESNMVPVCIYILFDCRTVSETWERNRWHKSYCKWTVSAWQVCFAFMCFVLCSSLLRNSCTILLKSCKSFQAVALALAHFLIILIMWNSSYWLIVCHCNVPWGK